MIAPGDALARTAAQGKGENKVRFLLRLTFWLSVVLLVLPYDRDTDGGKADPVGPLQVASAAQEAISDIMAICDRKPDVCVAGRQAAQMIGERAREGARLAYEALDRKFGDPDAAAVTGGIPAKP